MADTCVGHFFALFYISHSKKLFVVPIDKKRILYYSYIVEKNKRNVYIILASGFLFAIVIGGFLGALLAGTVNLKNNEHFTEYTTTLPTRLLDINGELITEFSSDEKRQIIEFSSLPQHLVDALITREDDNFFEHPGFNLLSIIRAAIGQVFGRNLGGGSTLTQQIAGTLYLDRTEITITRKIYELWWAIQMERRYSKEEILELYLNEVYLGDGTYGVNSASEYYFGHGAQDITAAEAALLVIQLSNPTYYNPFEYPNRAMDRQRYVLDEMVSFGYLTKEDADLEYENFWLNFDYTRISSSAYYLRDDKAPWFSEYVRRELEDMMYGTMNVYTDGYTVHTTMNMKHQLAAQDIMKRWIEVANKRYNDSNTGDRRDIRYYAPMSELLSLVFDIPQIKVSQQRVQLNSLTTFKNEINPMLDVLSLMFDIDDLKVGVVNRANALASADTKKNTVEGTMISLANDTGYINALVGGSEYTQDNQFIRATQAMLQPGSSFKPLVYTAAIDSKEFTQATVLDDSPYVFKNDDGTPYIPQNFLGEWSGSVQLWYALASSMNVPTLKILQGVGFAAALSQAGELLGIPVEDFQERGMLPYYPLALGVSSVTPLEMAKAFAVFPNQGIEVVPLAIRTVEDRNGAIVLEPEKEVRIAQQEKGRDAELLTPQTAYVMTDMLKGTITAGTLRSPTSFGDRFTYLNENGDEYILPMAGKTGTTQNSDDAWTVGFSPYYTAAFWFGFDSRGQSLGPTITGSTLAGWAWAEFMYVANEDESYKDFTRPATGLTTIDVCYVSGQLLTSVCNEGKTTRTFLDGTVPVTTCEYHTAFVRNQARSVENLRQSYATSGVNVPTFETENSSELTLDLSFLEASSLEEFEEINLEAEERRREEESNVLPTTNSLLN